MARNIRDEYMGAVIYETWRRGGNPDRVDVERVRESQDGDLTEYEAACVEIRAQRKARAATKDG